MCYLDITAETVIYRSDILTILGNFKKMEGKSDKINIIPVGYITDILLINYITIIIYVNVFEQ